MQFFDPLKTSKFLSSYPTIKPEEIFSEFTTFLRNLNPNLILSETNDIITKVKSELGIDTILANISKLNVEKLLHISKGHQLLEHLGIFLGKSLKFLCPPVTVCILCEKQLTKNNQPTQVVVHTVNGPQMYTKYIYRCRGCKMSKNNSDKSVVFQPQDVYYHPDKVIVSRSDYIYTCFLLMK